LRCVGTVSKRGIEGKMRKIIITLFLSAVFVSAQNEYTMSVDAFFKDGIVNESKPITGLVKGYHENGEVKAEIFYKDGKKEGVAKYYYENGNVLFEVPYKNDKEEGVVKRYYINKNIEYEIPHKNGMKDGVWKKYFANGAVLQIQNKNGYAQSGFCVSQSGKKTKFTKSEIDDLNMGLGIDCEK
jgi:antitoxin component YwqK of YwqJK toxin-antitoxin module